MKSHKARSNSASNKRREQVPSVPTAMTNTYRGRERITFALKEFKVKANSKSKRKPKHERQRSLPYRSPRFQSDDDTMKEEGLEIGKVLLNAREILEAQRSLLAKCTEMTKVISKTDIELDSLGNRAQVDNERFMLTINQFRKKIEDKANERNDQLIEEQDAFKASLLNEMNSLNEMIGKLGYNYLYHKFKHHNFNTSSISEYFSNAKKLLTALSRREEEANSVIHKQQQQIEAQSQMIASYQHQLRLLTETKPIRAIPTEEVIQPNSLSSMSSSQNPNIVSSSNLFDSNSFFEGYKRNKDLRSEMALEHNYSEMNISQSTVKPNDRTSQAEFHFTK